jgi:uncharacterized protein YwgA
MKTIEQIKDASAFVDYLNSQVEEYGDYDEIIEQNGWYDLSTEKVSEDYFCITNKGKLVEMREGRNGDYYVDYRDADEWAERAWDNLSEEAKEYIRNTGILG